METPNSTRFTNAKLDKSDVLNADRYHGCPYHWITIRHRNRKYRCIVGGECWLLPHEKRSECSSKKCVLMNKINLLRKNLGDSCDYHYRTCANFIIKGVPAKFQKYLKHISWVISGTSSSKVSCNPRHLSWNISCNHRHHLLQPSWRRIFSTWNNQKPKVDSDINSDYRASSFDGLYIWCRKWDTVGFVRAHQWKYWYALTVGRGHDVDGCSCNHRAFSPSGSPVSNELQWLKVRSVIRVGVPVMTTTATCPIATRQVVIGNHRDKTIYHRKLLPTTTCCTTLCTLCQHVLPMFTCGFTRYIIDNINIWALWGWSEITSILCELCHYIW